MLALETSTDACSVALWNRGEQHEQYKVAPREHTQLILPMVDQLLRESGLELGQIDAIAFGCGPGAFTGVRVAACVAQGLALGADIPVVPVSTLAAVAYGAFEQDPTYARCLVLVDARMNEVYWGAYSRNEGEVITVGQEAVSQPEALFLPEADFSEGVLIAGTGWECYASRLPDVVRNCAGKISACQLPHAKAVLALALRQFEKEGGMAPEKALPNYLRNSVATPPKPIVL
jgi:tRNA threonylcarbamoyladenosine biosynthesis protein TsaB